MEIAETPAGKKVGMDGDASEDTRIITTIWFMASTPSVALGLQTNPARFMNEVVTLRLETLYTTQLPLLASG
jgi:hypothetical protein